MSCLLIISIVLLLFILKLKEKQMVLSFGENSNVFRKEKKTLVILLIIFVLSYIIDFMYMRYLGSTWLEKREENCGSGPWSEEA